MVDSSMSSTQRMAEGMYAIALQVLCAIGETGTVKPEFLHDDIHIRHTMHEVATLEYASVGYGCGNTPRFAILVERSRQRVAGNEPQKEQKGT